MTLYQFNRLSEEEQIFEVWNTGIFLDNYILETEILSCFAIDNFFVELVYNAGLNKVVEVRSFEGGWCLDKYAPNFKTEY